MRSSSKILILSMVLLAGLVTPHAAAQTGGPQVLTNPDPAPSGMPTGQALSALSRPTKKGQPDAFGGYNQWTNIHASRFVPQMGAVPPTYVGAGWVTITDIGGAYFPSYYAQIDLPNGAEITDIYAWLYDNTANAYWRMTVVGYEANSQTFVTYSDTDRSTPSVPGYTYLYASFATNPLVRAYADIDGDGNESDVAFTVNLIPQGTVGDYSDKLRFWGVCIKWHRTISPAPASPTFPDVPTSFWAFQYVEALAASGITQGMPDGKFHPKDPVTRAQMATFLARALGLHWGL